MNVNATFEGVAAQLLPVGDFSSDASAGAEEGLHVCPACGSRLVHPTWSDEDGEASWLVALRCPSCEAFRLASFDDETIAEFERELDRGVAELSSDLERLVHANMVDYLDRFTRALEADAIQPTDFQPVAR
jgi:hypothetical protein